MPHMKGLTVVPSPNICAIGESVEFSTFKPKQIEATGHYAWFPIHVRLKDGSLSYQHWLFRKQSVTTKVAKSVLCWERIR